MAYSDFTIEMIKEQFGIHLEEDGTFFAKMPSVTVSSLLLETLAENVPLAQAISTEKARSELIIMPVLMEARRQAGRKVSQFSGIEAKHRLGSNRDCANVRPTRRVSLILIPLL